MPAAAFENTFEIGDWGWGVQKRKGSNNLGPHQLCGVETPVVKKDLELPAATYEPLPK